MRADGGFNINGSTVFHDGYHPNADKWTTARTLSLSGDASGSVSWDGSGNATLSVAVANDSHTHDGRYYTESEADTRFVNQTGDTMTGPLTIDTNTSGMLVLSATNGSPWAIDLQRDDETNSRVFNRGGYWSFEHTPRVGASTIWHAGNDGSGSGLDADLLDGVQGSSYLRSDAVDSLVPSGWTGPNTYAALNIGYNGSGQTRAIDIYGSWASGESKTISFTHGSSLTNLVGQFEVRFDNPASRMRWGRLYHGGDSSVYPMELVSQSQTTANLYVTGTVEATSFTGDGSNLTGIDAGAPAGSIIYHAGSSAPSGYVKANGASLSTSTYAALFSAIGYTFGGSGGSFNVPDLRGEFLRGWDDSRGVDSGRSFGSSQLDQMQRLTGGYNTSAEHFNIGSGSGVFNDYRVGGARNSGIGYGNATRLDFDSANSPSARVSSSTSGETRPRNIALLACIKY